MNWLALLMTLHTMKSCGTGDERAVLNSLTSTPDIPMPGDNVTLAVDYTFGGTAITGGTATYDVTLNYIPVYNEQFDLCTQTSCPKQPGTYTETSVSSFPTGVSGTLVSTIHWTDQDNNPIWCVKTTWKV